MLLFIDVETSGRIYGDRKATDPAQGYVRQIACSLTDDKATTSFLELYANVDNGMSKTLGKAVDIPEFMPAAVLCSTLKPLLRSVTYVVGHNVTHDLKAVEALFAHNDKSISFFADLPCFCTMIATRSLCKLPMLMSTRRTKWNKEVYKYPTLDEAFCCLVDQNQAIEHRHDARADMEACKEIYKSIDASRNRAPFTYSMLQSRLSYYLSGKE